MLRKDGQPSDESIDTCPEVFIIHTALPRVHADERIANDVLDKRADVDLAQDEPKRVRAWVRQHDELVTGERFVEMQLVRRRAVVDELFVPGPQPLVVVRT